MQAILSVHCWEAAETAVFQPWKCSPVQLGCCKMWTSVHVQVFKARYNAVQIVAVKQLRAGEKHTLLQIIKLDPDWDCDSVGYCFSCLREPLPPLRGASNCKALTRPQYALTGGALASRKDPQ